MHLCLLVTNTDRSEFASTRPDDPEKFSTMIHALRPDWRVTSFDVTQHETPDDFAPFDGVMITGSPASVLDNPDWLGRLLEIIRSLYTSQKPLFGACFGHQAIALALGGTVIKNPKGLIHGLVQVVQDAPCGVISLYASHSDIVDKLPSDMEICASSAGCKTAGLKLRNHIYTTQYHPEITQEFMTDLTEEMRDYMGPELYKAALQSLDEPNDNSTFATQIISFFEKSEN